jgi:hypothetical protein
MSSLPTAGNAGHSEGLPAPPEREGSEAAVLGGAHVGLHDFDEFNRERAGRRTEDGLFGTELLTPRSPACCMASEGLPAPPEREGSEAADLSGVLMPPPTAYCM